MSDSDRSILQPWVSTMGLRHQGVLLSAVRGCDTLPKHHPSKRMVRIYRGCVLNPFCGDVRKAASFMEPYEPHVFYEHLTSFLRSIDEMPNHYLMHFLHAAQILGYYHYDEAVLMGWRTFYDQVCMSLHLYPENKEQLDDRLSANEEEFAKQQSRYDIESVRGV